jgi:transposase
MEYEHYLYCWTHVNSNRVYIGKGKGKRARTHMKNAFNKSKANCSRFYNAIRKYGPAEFKLSYLAAGLTNELACELEKAAIVAYESKGPKGFNLTDGGEGAVGVVISPSHRMAMSQAGIRRLGTAGRRQQAADEVSRMPPHNACLSHLAAKHGVTSSAISRWLSDAGLTWRPANGAGRDFAALKAQAKTLMQEQPGITASALGRMLAVDAKTTLLWMKAAGTPAKPRPRVTDDVKDQIREALLRSEGAISCIGIAKRLGVSADTVTAEAVRLGLQLTPRKGRCPETNRKIDRALAFCRGQAGLVNSAEIARLFDIRPATAYLHLKKAGIPMHARGQVFKAKYTGDSGHKSNQRRRQKRSQKTSAV